MSDSPILFEEIFEVRSVNPDGKAFEKGTFTILPWSAVTRFAATSVTYGMDMLIDINTDIYPLKGTDRFSLVLASKLYKDNRLDPGVYMDYSKEVFRKILGFYFLAHFAGWLWLLHARKSFQISVQRRW